MISGTSRPTKGARDRWPAQATASNNPTPTSRMLKPKITVTPPRFRVRNEKPKPTDNGAVPKPA